MLQHPKQVLPWILKILLDIFRYFQYFFMRFIASPQGHPTSAPGLPRRRGVPPRRSALHGAPGTAGRQRRRAAEPGGGHGRTRQEPQTAQCAEDAKMQSWTWEKLGRNWEMKIPNPLFITMSNGARNAGILNQHVCSSGVFVGQAKRS